MIYFIQCEGTVKIGYSNNPHMRMVALKTSNPLELTMLLITEGNNSDETALHERFKKDHYRGEWFVLSDDIKDYIKSVQKSNKDLRYELGLMDSNEVYGELTRLRNNHSLSLRAVGELLGITAPSVRETELREKDGSITIKGMRKYGKALGYLLIYKFIYDPASAAEE